MSTPLQVLYGYHTWANAELLEKLDALDPERHGSELQAALRLIGHYHVTAQIFAGHLQGVPHGFASDNFERMPTLAELQAAVASSDRWYLDYIATVSSEALSEAVAFTFTDGDEGCMTRQEMLTHVATHAVYHRGEAGRVLKQIAITPPYDTFAVYLHRTEPARRARRELAG